MRSTRISRPFPYVLGAALALVAFAVLRWHAGYLSAFLRGAFLVIAAWLVWRRPNG